MAMAAERPRSAEALCARLDPQAVRALLERLTGLPAISTWTLHHQRPIRGAAGYNSITAPVSITYEADGCHGWCDLLLKWSEGASVEERWYPPLVAAGAPIPRLLGQLTASPLPDGDHATVLVLEYLPHIGTQQGDRAALAVALGRLHAIPPTLLPDLPQVWAHRAVASWAEQWQRVRTHALAGDLGDELRTLAAETRSWAAVHAALPALAEDCDAAPRGMIHRDISLQNCGWRAERRELLLFDLPQLAIGALAEDVQALCGTGEPLAAPIAGIYAETLARHGGLRLEPERIIAQVARIRPVWNLNFLWWACTRSLDGRVDFTADVEAGKRWYRATLTRVCRELITWLAPA